MKAIIGIRDLKLNVLIGIFPEEQTKPRPVVVNIHLTTDCSEALKFDDLKNIPDYYELVQNIKHKTEQSRFRLLESLTGFIIKEIMKNKNILEATVRVEKPNAFPEAEAVFVEMKDTNPHDSSKPLS